MKWGQDEAAERLIKKARKEKSYIFNKKGNQDQFEFNEKIAEEAEAKIDALARVSKSSSKAFDGIISTWMQFQLGCSQARSSHCRYMARIDREIRPPNPELHIRS